MFTAKVEALRPLIEAAKASLGIDIPTDYALAWIALESAGDILGGDRYSDSHGGLSSARERGFTQIQDTEATEMLGLSPEEFARLSTDPVFSITQGVRHIDAYRKKTQAILGKAGYHWTPKDWDFWGVAKLYHALPVAAKELVAIGPAANWGAFVKRSLDAINDGRTSKLTAGDGAHWVSRADAVLRLAINNEPSNTDMVRL